MYVFPGGLLTQPDTVKHNQYCRNPNRFRLLQYIYMYRRNLNQNWNKNKKNMVVLLYKLKWCWC